ncbi:Nn.00g117330.m01.CDS01 [Neocucurbitaria sp. VM-36]
MARAGNNSMKSTTSYSSFHLVLFTLIGALTAILLMRCKQSITIHPNAPHLIGNTSPSIAINPKVKILSFDPFIAHISDFIPKSEREYLLKLGNPLLKKSIIRNDDGTEVISEARTSSTAFLPEEDPVVLSIAQRAADFQGYLSPEDIDVQITSYNPGQQYKHHYDWYPPPRSRNRVSTFFAILKSSCESCGTEFPFINTTERARFDDRWCDVIDCEKELLTTRNIEGSALFWLNLDGRGEGRMDMLHAGLPAVNGDKVGLNIWTDIDLQELKSRGLFGGQSRHYFKPSKEFLESHGLVNGS